VDCLAADAADQVWRHIEQARAVNNPAK
jgi:GAF domain-containing protein